jgi:hypothetical protein
VYKDSPIITLTLLTKQATGISSSSAIMNADVVFDTGNYNDIAYAYFKYRTSGGEWLISSSQSISSVLGFTRNIEVALEDLTASRTTEYQICIFFDTESCGNILSFTTLSESSGSIIVPPQTPDESEIDELWSVLLGGSSFGKWLVAFFIIFAIIFIGVSQFGQHNIQIGPFGIMIMLFLGVTLTTILGLMPWYILLILIIGPLMFIIMKVMFFGTGAGE